jgi:hypothetical protein
MIKLLLAIALSVSTVPPMPTIPPTLGRYWHWVTPDGVEVPIAREPIDWDDDPMNCWSAFSDAQTGDNLPATARCLAVI